MRLHLLRRFAGVALLCGGGTLGAQSVSGRVVDHASGRPLPDTRVQLLRPRSGAPAATTQADSAGIFALKAPTAGVYRLVFAPPGHERQTAPEFSLDDTSYLEREFRIALVPPSATTMYFEFQVEQPVSPLGGGAPVYPPELRAQRVEGDVIVQFIVDTAGTVEPGSMRVLEASRPEFTQAVHEALPSLRFRPARIGRITVRQLVQQPFQFRIQP